MRRLALSARCAPGAPPASRPARVCFHKALRPGRRCSPSLRARRGQWGPGGRTSSAGPRGGLRPRSSGVPNFAPRPAAHAERPTPRRGPGRVRRHQVRRRPAGRPTASARAHPPRVAAPAVAHANVPSPDSAGRPARLVPRRPRASGRAPAASPRLAPLTSISKSGRRNAVRKSEQKCAMAGTSHHERSSPSPAAPPSSRLISRPGAAAGTRPRRLRASAPRAPGRLAAPAATAARHGHELGRRLAAGSLRRLLALPAGSARWPHPAAAAAAAPRPAQYNPRPAGETDGAVAGAGP